MSKEQRLFSAAAEAVGCNGEAAQIAEGLASHGIPLNTQTAILEAVPQSRGRRNGVKRPQLVSRVCRTTHVRAAVVKDVISAFGLVTTAEE